MTFVSLLRGDRRSDKALGEAQNFLAQSADAPPPDLHTPGSKPPVVEDTAGNNPLRQHAREALVAQVR